MTVIDFPTTPPWLARYYEQGFRLIFYPSGQKGPSGKDAVNWPSRDDKAEDYKAGMNVGTFTGHELSPGRFLADIDYDWAEGFPLAKRILPITEFGFGRETRKITHGFYTTPTPIPLMAFKTLDVNKNYVELRGTKADGTIGLQTMLPPSIHPNGEKLNLLTDTSICHCEDLPRRVALYATACLLFNSFPSSSMAHDARMASVGFLFEEGLTVAEVESIIAGVTEACGNNVADALEVVKSTSERVRNSEHVVGKNKLIQIIGEQGRKVIAQIKEWVGNSGFIEDSKGRIVATSQENVKRAMDKVGMELSYDVFAQKPMVIYENPQLNGNSYRGPLVDSVVRQGWLEIDEKYHFRPAKDFFYDVAENVAQKNKFHPVLDYLSALKWDGVDRMDEWLIRGGQAVDTDYVRAVSRIMLLAAVRRVTQPGCKYDEMLVLESSQQGLLKSTALRSLCPNDKWFSDDLPLNVDAKQIVERTLGKWIIEASDLSGMHVSQVEHLKGMLSRQVDGPVRLAYGRLPVEQPRQFIVVGTTNSSTYLTDSTGNRRFWPITVKKFDIAWIIENRNQLWAEATSREKAGESIRLDPKLYDSASQQQEKRRAEDPWEVKLAEVFGRETKWRLTPDEVWGALGIAIDRRDLRANERVLKAMANLKFIRLAVKDTNKNVTRGFARDIIAGQQEFTDTED